MNQRMSAIAALVIAAALTGIFSTTPMAVYADESETNTDQSVKQKNVGSGDSVNFNCGENLIKAGVGEQACGNDDDEAVILAETPTMAAPTLTTPEPDIMDNPLFDLSQLDVIDEVN
jgi:hypothetical protein